MVQNVRNRNAIPTSFRYIANGVMLPIAVSPDIWRPQMGLLLKKLERRSNEPPAALSYMRKKIGMR